MSFSHFFPGKEGRIGSGTRFIEDLVDMVVPGLPVGRICRPVQGHHSLVVLVIGPDERARRSSDSNSHDPSFMFCRLLSNIEFCYKKGYIFAAQANVLRSYSSSEIAFTTSRGS
jgi:hypothetical protein